MGERRTVPASHALVIAALGASLVQPSALARDIDPAVIDTCKDARDFQGCVNAFSSQSATPGERDNPAAANNPEQCNDDGWCIANAGLDIFGLPKVVGWSYKTLDNGIHYRGPKLYKIKHKGKSNRYLGQKFVHHYYQEAIPATSGYYRTVSAGRKQCGYNTNGSYYCYTTAPRREWVPGQPGQAGGSRVRHYTWVGDCIDKTYAYYEKGRLRGKWKKGEPPSTCDSIETLPRLRIKL